MKTKKYFVIIMITLVFMSCSNKTDNQKLMDLKCGEKTTLTDNFCNKIINTKGIDSIKFGEKQYRIEKKYPLIMAAITGSLEYSLSDGKKEFNISIVSNESPLNQTSAIVERIH